MATGPATAPAHDTPPPPPRFLHYSAGLVGLEEKEFADPSAGKELPLRAAQRSRRSDQSRFQERMLRSSSGSAPRGTWPAQRASMARSWILRYRSSLSSSATAPSSSPIRPAWARS